MGDWTVYRPYDWYSTGHHAWAFAFAFESSWAQVSFNSTASTTDRLKFHDADGTNTFVLGTGLSFDHLGVLHWDSISKLEHRAADGSLLERIVADINSHGADDARQIAPLLLSQGPDIVNGSADRDIAYGGTQNDLLYGGGGADQLAGGDGDDIFLYKSGSELVAGEIIHGDSGSDTVRLANTGDIDFRGINFNFEKLEFFSGKSIAHFDLVDLVFAQMNVIGSAGVDSLVIEGIGQPDNDDLTKVTFTNWSSKDQITILVPSRPSQSIGGSNENDHFVYAGARVVAVDGHAGADVFEFNSPDLVTGDSGLAGGLGTDTIQMLAAGTLTTLGNGAITGIEKLQLADGSNNISLPDSIVASSDTHILTIIGGAGNDTVNTSAVTAPNRVIMITGGGDDSLTGGAGNDIFRFNIVDLNGSDSVAGGAGADVLQFLTAGTADPMAFVNVSGVETVALANGTNSIALTDAMVGSADGHAVTVTGTAGNDAVDASGVTTAANHVVFQSGDGNDSLTGGAGNDVFRFATAGLTTLDVVAGGSGTDMLKFLTAGTVGADAFSHVSGIEAIVLYAGTNSVVLLDSMVGTADAQMLKVTGATGADTIDASGLTSAHRVNLISGGGNDTFTGGAGNDIFQFRPDEFSSLDKLTGGGGADTLQFQAAGTVLANAFAHVAGIDAIQLANGGNTVTLSDSLVASADLQILTITGGTGNDTIDASGVTHSVIFKSGAGNDNLKGGSASDTLIGGVGADTLAGQLGADTFTFTGLSDSTHAAFDTIQGFAGGIGAGHDFVAFQNSLGLTTVDGSIATDSIAAHHIGWKEVGAETIVYANASKAAQNLDSASFEIHLSGTGLGLTANDFLLHA